MTIEGSRIDTGLFQAVVRNSAWSAFAVVASPLLQFVFGGLTLKYLGLEATGFSLAVGAVFGIAGRFGTFGIGEASLPALASATTSLDILRARRLIGLVLVVYLASSVITGILIYVGSDSLISWSRVPISNATASVFVACSCITFVLTQTNQAISIFLRAAGRYDLVTAVTTPLALVSGIVACAVLPLFPSLITVGLVGLASASATLLVSMVAVSKTVPGIRHPLLSFSELPVLARYGFWMLLTHAFSALTAGIDDLVIAGACGASALPPWAIGKRLWLTAHTFLGQHTEHLIPTLSSMRHKRHDSVEGMVMGMHWYLVLLGAVGYTFMATCGEILVGLVTGPSVAAICQPAIFGYSVFGLVMVLTIIPVIAAMAEGKSRPAFIVSFVSNTAQLSAVFLLARLFGVPAVYYAPIGAVPVLLMATGTTPTSIFEAQAALRRLHTVFVPLTAGVVGVVASTAFTGRDVSAMHRLVLGGTLAAGVFIVTLVVERQLAVNLAFHAQLLRVSRYALSGSRPLVGRAFASVRQIIRPARRL